MNKSKVIVVVGPTSSGKTSLSIELAKKFNGEIISADSRQVYRGLDIASGKVTKEEMGDVTHHLLDITDSKEVFSASDFVKLGKVALDNVFKNNHIPIIAGGTGFYIDALLGRISLAEVEPNEKLRKELESKSIEELQEILRNLDLERFESIDIQNPRRLVRSIEVAKALGKNPKPNANVPYEILWIGLEVPHEDLKKKIHERLLQRLEEGMVDEIKELHQNGLPYERLEQLGLECRYISMYLKEELEYEEMVKELETEIVHYAKRQMTWFKKNKDIKWFSPKNLEEVSKLTEKFIQK